MEEDSAVGGLGSAIAEYAARRGEAPRQLFIGLPDAPVHYGDYKFLLRKYGLTGSQIACRVMEALECGTSGASK